MLLGELGGWRYDSRLRIYTPVNLPIGNVVSYVMETKKCLADGPRSGRSVVVARTVCVCEESVRVPSFSWDLLTKTVGLTWKTV
jgi:hypothetical protein